MGGTLADGGGGFMAGRGENPQAKGLSIEDRPALARNGRDEPGHDVDFYLDPGFALSARPGMTRFARHFTSFRPVIFSRLPYMIALYFAFDRSRLSKIFSVSRM